ncbi:AraC-like DNA-binding protein [Rhizobium aquaticum]|uniref:AraC-like DNA-binding protein n=1 Tax=Rhizobium aquaticum TaxID=1549636 RepID=A0ABV2IY31_9HYPH
MRLLGSKPHDARVRRIYRHFTGALSQTACRRPADGARMNAEQDTAVDALGCSLKKIGESREAAGSYLKFYHRESNSEAIGRVETTAAERGLLIGMSTRAGHRRAIFQGRSVIQQEFERNSFYVRDFSEDYKADLGGNFDFQLLEISNIGFERMCEAVGVSEYSRLTLGVHGDDLVLSGLLSALNAAVSDQRECSLLFVDQMSLAIGTHLLRYYGSHDAAATKRGTTLSAVQMKRVKDLIDNSLSGDIPVSMMATACGDMPGALFVQAFRETTGETPHQWLLARRTEKAKALLLETKLSVAEISQLCGFADQSHLTRVFSRKMGTPPGTWRRRHRS